MMSARRRTLARRRVVVNLKSGTVLTGVVWDARGPLLVLRGAELVADRGAQVKPQRLDGEVLVEVAEVDFVQSVGAG